MRLCLPFSTEERDPLLCNRQRDRAPTAPKWRWFALAAFSIFSFSSALMWDTFAPCVYIFVDYYFETRNTWTTNAINSLSSVYMLLYPFVIQTTFGFFEDKGDLPGSGLKRGLLIGAFINLVAGAARWLGAVPSVYGFAILSFGQVLAAIAQGFMLAVPPRLASAWFPETEVNLATSLAVSANNLGVAVGCVWTPLVVKARTMHQDIPHLLVSQFFICIIAFLLIWISFQRRPPFCEKVAIGDATSKEQSKQVWRQRSFHCMMFSYGIIMGAQCAIITLLAQILLPPFRYSVDESFVGYLGFAMLVTGLPASILAGFYLDRTLQYRYVCLALFVATSVSVAGLYFTTEFRFLPGVTASCIMFGFSSYAIAPAIFQYASEMYYPVSEIIPTGYLLTSGNVWGVLLVFLMGWSEDTSDAFSMRIPMICLVIMSVVGLCSMTQVKGRLKRLEALSSKPL